MTFHDFEIVVLSLRDVVFGRPLRGFGCISCSQTLANVQEGSISLDTKVYTIRSLARNIFVQSNNSKKLCVLLLPTIVILNFLFYQLATKNQVQVQNGDAVNRILLHRHS